MAVHIEFKGSGPLRPHFLLGLQEHFPAVSKALEIREKINLMKVEKALVILLAE